MSEILIIGKGAAGINAHLAAAMVACDRSCGVGIVVAGKPEQSARETSSEFVLENNILNDVVYTVMEEPNNPYFRKFEKFKR